MIDDFCKLNAGDKTKNIFIHFNFEKEINEKTEFLFEAINSVKKDIVMSEFSKVFSNLFWEAFFVTALLTNTKECKSNLKELLEKEFKPDRGEDSNWYNHTNNPKKILGRINDIKNYFKI